MIKYEVPPSWCRYNLLQVVEELVAAKGCVMSLGALPHQKRWVEALQEMQLKLEVAGTSKIEGADFAGNELDQAMKETPEQLHTRSQRQAHAATRAYRWIAALPRDHPITEELICNIHRQIVTGADDDHCPPGQMRQRDQNVTFGVPPHRGTEGGAECNEMFSRFVQAVNGEFREHDALIRPLIAHYHFAAMHPFIDGNGRTARALEALMLQRVGMPSTLFIAMSNYYYDEKKQYLSTLAEVRSGGYDLTPFIKFGLRGVALQTKRLADVLRENISKELFRSLLHDFYTRLMSTRKRVIGERQIRVADYLLRHGSTEFETLVKALDDTYRAVANPRKAIVRDVNYLQSLRAVRVTKDQERYYVDTRLDWPTTITEGEFFAKVKELSKAKATAFLATS